MTTNMKISENFKFAILLIIVVISMTVAVIQPKYTVQYDCRVAEISPDFPQAVRDECRKMMKE